MMILIWVTCPATINWSVVTKCDSFFITKCVNFITKCEDYYKVQ